MSFTSLADIPAAQLSTENPKYIALNQAIDTAQTSIEAFKQNLDAVTQLSRSVILKNVSTAEIKKLRQNSEAFFNVRIQKILDDHSINDQVDIHSLENFIKTLPDGTVKDELEKIDEGKKSLINVQSLFSDKDMIKAVDGDIYGTVLEALTGERFVQKSHSASLDYDFSRALVSAKVGNNQPSRLQVTNYIFASKNYNSPIKKSLDYRAKQVQNNLQALKETFLDFYEDSEPAHTLVAYLQVLTDVTSYFSGLISSGQRARDSSDFGSKTIYSFFEKWETFFKIKDELLDSKTVSIAAQNYQFGEGKSYGVLLTREQIKAKTELDSFLSNLVGKYRGYLNTVGGESGYSSLAPAIEKKETVTFRTDLVKELVKISKSNNNVIPNKRLDQIKRYSEEYSFRFLTENYFNRLIARQNPAIFWEPSVTENTDTVSPESTFGDHLEDTYTNVTRPKIEEVLSLVKAQGTKITYIPFMLGGSMYLIPSYSFNLEQQKLVLVAYVNLIWHRLSESKRAKFQGKMTRYIDGVIGGPLKTLKVLDVKSLRSDLTQTFGFQLPAVMPDRTSVKDEVQVRTFNNRIDQLATEIDKTLDKARIREKEQVLSNLNKDIQKLSKEPLKKKIQSFLSSITKTIITEPSDVRIKEFRDLKGREIQLLTQAIEDLKYILGIDEDSYETEERLIVSALNVAIKKTKQSLKSFLQSYFPNEPLLSLVQWEDSFQSYISSFKSRSLEYQLKFLELIYWDTLFGRTTRQNYPKDIDLTLVLTTIEKNIDFDYIFDDYSYSTVEEARLYLASLHTAVLNNVRNQSEDVSVDSIQTAEELNTTIEKLIPVVESKIQQLKSKLQKLLLAQQQKIARRLRPIYAAKDDIDKLIQSSLNGKISTNPDLLVKLAENVSLYHLLFFSLQLKQSNINTVEFRRQIKHSYSLVNDIKSLVKRVDTNSDDSVVQTKKEYLRQLLDILSLTHRRLEFKNYELTSDRQNNLFKLLKSVYLLGKARTNKLKLYLNLLGENDSLQFDINSQLQKLTSFLNQRDFPLNIDSNLLRETSQSENFIRYFYKVLIIEQFLIPFSNESSEEVFNPKLIDINSIQKQVTPLLQRFIVNKKIHANKVEAYLKFLKSAFNNDVFNFKPLAVSEETNDKIQQQQAYLLGKTQEAKSLVIDIQRILSLVAIKIKESIPNIITSSRIITRAKFVRKDDSEFWNNFYIKIQDVLQKGNDGLLQNNTFLDDSFYKLFQFQKVLSEIFKDFTEQKTIKPFPYHETNFHAAVKSQNLKSFVESLINGAQDIINEFNQMLNDPKGLDHFFQSKEKLGSDLKGQVSLKKLKIKTSELSKLVEVKYRELGKSPKQLVSEETSQLNKLLQDSKLFKSVKKEKFELNREIQKITLLAVTRLLQANKLILFKTEESSVSENNTFFQQLTEQVNQSIQNEDLSIFVSFLIVKIEEIITELSKLQFEENKFESQEDRKIYDQSVNRIKALEAKIQTQIESLDPKSVQTNLQRRLVFAEQTFDQTWKTLKQSLDSKIKQFDNPLFSVYVKYLAYFEFYSSLLQPEITTENSIAQVREAILNVENLRSEPNDIIKQAIEKLESRAVDISLNSPEVESDAENFDEKLAEIAEIAESVVDRAPAEEFELAQNLDSVGKTDDNDSGIKQLLKQAVQAIPDPNQITNYKTHINAWFDSKLNYIKDPTQASYVGMKDMKDIFHVMPIKGPGQQLGQVTLFKWSGNKLVPMNLHRPTTPKPQSPIINARLKTRRLFAEFNAIQYENQFPDHLKSLIRLIVNYDIKLHGLERGKQKIDEFIANFKIAINKKDINFLNKLKIAVEKIKSNL